MEEIKQLLRADRPVKWLFYGDSITHGALHTFGWRDYTQIFAERLRYEMGRSMDVVINTAISGNSTRELLQGFDWRVAQFQPDVLLLMIGIAGAITHMDEEVRFQRFFQRRAETVDQVGRKVRYESDRVDQADLPQIE